MARVALRRGATFVYEDGVKLVDAASTAIVDAAAADVAEWLGFASFAEYQAATPDVREQRVTAMEIR